MVLDWNPFDREHERNQHDLSILLGVNPLPVSTIPKTIAEFQEKFYLRSEILKNLPKQERDEICRIVSLDKDGLKEILVAKTLQDLMDRVHTVYERVLAGQIQYEGKLEEGKFVSIRRFEWTDESPLFLHAGDSKRWVYLESALKKGE